MTPTGSEQGKVLQKTGTAEGTASQNHFEIQTEQEKLAALVKFGIRNVFQEGTFHRGG